MPRLSGMKSASGLGPRPVHPDLPARTQLRSGRPTLHKALAQKQNSNSDPTDKTKVKIDLFETAGTAEDRTGWEPLGGNASTPSPFGALLSTIDFSEPMTFDGEEKTEYDPLRDGPLRYLGYANELGEAFAAWLFPGGVPLSYAVAIGYVLFDTVDKYNKTLNEAQQKLSARSLPPSVDLSKLVSTIGAERGVDTLVWQLIASVAAPGYTIHTVVALVTSLIKTVEEQPGVAAGLRQVAAAVGAAPDGFVETLNKSLPTAVGLLTIPFIVHPIDAAVHAVLNATLRPALRQYICTEAGGAEAGLAVCKNCSVAGTDSD